MDRSLVLKYFFQEYFASSEAKFVTATGYTEQQLHNWLTGATTPLRSTIEYIVHCAVSPEFKIVTEYAEFAPTKALRSQLRTILKGHESRAGIYALYDSMVNLIYVGKATNLLDEVYQAMRQPIKNEFPKGLLNTPSKRYEVVGYISAYDVGISDWIDYPKHVESLILRISKPVLNRQIGKLRPLESFSD